MSIILISKLKVICILTRLYSTYAAAYIRVSFTRCNGKQYTSDRTEFCTSAKTIYIFANIIFFSFTVRVMAADNSNSNDIVITTNKVECKSDTAASDCHEDWFDDPIERLNRNEEALTEIMFGDHEQHVPGYLDYRR